MKAVLILSALCLLPSVASADVELSGLVLLDPSGSLQVVDASLGGANHAKPITLLEPPPHLERLAKLGRFRARLVGQLSRGEFAISDVVTPRPFESHAVEARGRTVYEVDGKELGRAVGPAAKVLAHRSGERTSHVVEATWIDCAAGRRLVVVGVRARLAAGARIHHEFDRFTPQHEVVWLRSGPAPAGRSGALSYRVGGDHLFPALHFVRVEDVVTQENAQQGSGICGCLPAGD